MEERTLEIRDHRQPGWWWASNEIIDVYGQRLGAYGIAVYAVLCRHASNRSQQCWPGLDRIAGLVAISRRQAIKSIQALEAADLVQVERHPGQGNLYTLCTPVLVDDGESPVEPGLGDCESPGGSCESPGSDCETPDQCTPCTTTSAGGALPPVQVMHPNKTYLTTPKQQHQPGAGVFSQSLKGELTKLGMSVAGVMAVESNWSEDQAAKAVAWVQKLPQVANPAGYLLSLAKTNRDPDSFVLPTPEERLRFHQDDYKIANTRTCLYRDHQPCDRHFSWCSVCDLAG